MIQKGVKKANSKPVDKLYKAKLITPMTEAMKSQIEALAERKGIPMAILMREWAKAGLAQGGGL